jgi:uncharacterized membrane protein YfcA
VGAFGLTTAASYASDGLIDWRIAGEFIAGGVVGGIFGLAIARRLATHKGLLNRIFATLVLAVAAYVLIRSSAAWL